jgi:LmbE family N-acetylglucosaminyl deacetylase
VLLAAAPAAGQDAENPSSGDAPDDPVRILFIGAHPDDCDNKAGGTAAMLAERGHAVKFVSLTNGDAGHHEMGGGVLAKRRRAEAKEAGRRLGIEYAVLDYHDAELMPTLEVRKDVIRLIRTWDADVVVGHRPNDYHPDHRNAGIVVRDAAYMVQVPNVHPRYEPTDGNPVFLYFQDRFTRPYPFQHDVTIDVTPAIDDKVAALDAHESQMYEWLPWIGDRLDAVPDGDDARRAWLREIWIDPPSDAARTSLEEWYGPDTAQSSRHAESFQITEYGRQPSDAQIRELFPMLGE